MTSKTTSDVLTEKALRQVEKGIVLGTQCLCAEEDFPIQEFERFVAYARAVIAEVAGDRFEFSGQIEDILNQGWHLSVMAEGVIGVLEAVRIGIESGLLEGYQSLIRGELFSDYLDMADHLLDEGYKDAAAVIAGSSLEVHLRSLCEARTMPTVSEKDGKQIPKKADSLNTELRKNGCYSKTVWKSVVAWLAIRNDAAHGDYDKYTSEIVKAILLGVRDFIGNHPA
jgi:hypothetical protein